MPRLKTMADGDVVRAMASVLLRLGPSRFTLVDVAKEVGLSPATLVQRFGSKRGLMVAFANAAAEEATVPFDRARSEISSPIGALRAALVSASSDVRSRQEIANSLAVLLDDLTDDDMRGAAARHATRTEHAIRDLLVDAVRAGKLAPTDTAVLASSVQAVWNGAIIQWALRGAGTFDTFLTRVLRPLLPTIPVRRARRHKGSS